MHQADFRKPSSPGRLEPTEFIEPQLGTARPRRVQGLGYVPLDLPAGLTKAAILLPIHDRLLAAEQSLSELRGFARRLQNPGLLIGPLARREARKSSAIENTFASEQQLALFEIDASAVSEERRPEVRDVSNYLAALRHGCVDKRPICLNLIKEMHARLLEGSTRTAGRPGEFRRTQNAIGSPGASFEAAKFVPPPPAHLDACLRHLEAYINGRDDMPRLVRFALTHYQFECIHPFDDGNGRLGRLIVALQLCKQGPLSSPLVYISGFLEKNRERYYDLLYRVSSDGAWLEWLEFFLVGVDVQARDALTRAQSLDDLRTSYHQKVQQKRRSAMLPKLVDALFDRPAIAIADAARIAGMTPAGASRLIDQLVEDGIIAEATGRRHSRIFVADEILAIADRDLETEPSRSVGDPQAPPGPAEPNSA